MPLFCRENFIFKTLLLGSFYSGFATINSTRTAWTPTGLNTFIRSHLLERYRLHLIWLKNRTYTSNIIYWSRTSFKSTFFLHKSQNYSQ